MPAPLDDVLEFLATQRHRQAALLPQFGAAKVLSVMATSASPRVPPAVAVRRLTGVEPGPTAQELVARVAGALPRPPRRGECIAVSFASWAEFRGYQVKSHTLVDPGLESRLYRTADGETHVHASQVYTVHHTPQTANYFERVPFEEVAAVAGPASFALLAVGEQANLSPRWILHHEVRGRTLELFQGDALWSKTYLNVRRNPRETRLVLDPTTGEGFRMEGEIVEFEPEEHRTAADRICQTFEAAGLKRPTRLYRLRADEVTRLSLVS